MKIRFNRMLMQRFRSVLHFIDPLLRKNHKVCLTLGRTRFDLKKNYSNPWNIHAADNNAMIHLAQNFGLHIKGLKKVVWTNDKYEPCDLILSNDTRGVTKGKTAKKTINIPYMGFECYTPTGSVVVGNPLCQEIRSRSLNTVEKKNTVLIIHPGGGRDFLSPKRKQYPLQSVVYNNIELMSKTILALPSNILEVIIKTHPAPYRGCDYDSMVSLVLPHLKFSGSLRVIKDDLIGLICKSEFIINYGSSTSIWLLGSPKKWVNIIDQSKFNMKSKNRRDRIERASEWWSWPQNIPLNELCSMLEEYDNKVDRFLPFMIKYKNFYEIDAIDKCLKIIEKFGE